jgi:undecaprenyl-diphosphatase
LVPWLAGWSYGELDPRLRKSFEVSLHAGTAAALLARPPWREHERPLRTRCERERSGRAASKRLRFLLAATVPPALTGYALGGEIERRLGTPATIAAGLIAGSTALIAAELRARSAGARPRPGSRDPHMEIRGARRARNAGALDGFAIGLAQSLALAPGVSRSGASIAAARARGFSRRDADRLSWIAGLPVIGGATLLKGWRLARDDAPHELRLPLAVGATGAFVSTLASTKLLAPERRAALLGACAAYRVALAALVLARLRHDTR